MTVTYDHLRSLDYSIDVKLRSAPQNSDDLTPNASTLSFDGRADPLGYWGEGLVRTGDRSYTNDIATDGDMWAELQSLLELAEPAIWQRADGIEEFLVQVANAHLEPTPLTAGRLQRIRFHITKIAGDVPSS